MDRDIEMEESCTDRIAQRLEFPLSDEEDLHESEDHGVRSVADSISDMTTSSANLSSDRLDSSGNSDEGLGMSIPLSSPRKIPRFIRSRARDVAMSPPYSGVRALRLFDSPATPKTLLDNCHHASQIPVTPILATPAPTRTRTRTLFTAGSAIKSTGTV